MSRAGMDWAEAERMWRQTRAAEDRFDLVERALAAIAGGGPARADRQEMGFTTAGCGRNAGRTK